MKDKSSFSLLIFFVIVLIGAALAYALHIASESYNSLYILGGAVFIAYVISAAIKIANQWDRAIRLLSKPS